MNPKISLASTYLKAQECSTQLHDNIFQRFSILDLQCALLDSGREVSLALSNKLQVNLCTDD